VQYEVAQRLVAKAGDKNYSRVSLLIDYYCDAELILAPIPADAFYPPPEVRSAIVSMTLRRSPVATCQNRQLMRQLVAAGFRQRRKMLRNSLSFMKLPQQVIDSVFKELSIDPQVRAERLSVTQFAMLADAFSERLAAHAQSSTSPGTCQD
jgi:16S rRNA (adenine1518-N6/adenine1519-N6)-dimethyltransferase